MEKFNFLDVIVVKKVGVLDWPLLQTNWYFLTQSKELVGLLEDRGYDKGFVKEQVKRVRNLDRQVLIEQEGIFWTVLCCL